MKAKNKRLVALMTAAFVSASALMISGTTAMAEKKDSIRIWTKDGVPVDKGGQGGAAYTDGVYVCHLWNAGSPATGGAAENRTVDNIYLGYIGGHTNSGYAANVNPELDGAEPLGKNRYRLLPLIDSGSGTSVSQTISKDTAHAFSEYVNDFENATITLDMLKGSSYSTANLEHIDSFRLGLAYMDYDHPVTAYTNSTVYYTDIVWYDITTDVKALKGHSKSTSWKDVKTNVSVDVSDILAADHVRINGATAENCTVTAENANTFVLGIEFKDGSETYAATGHQLYFDNINISPKGAIATEEPTPEPTEEPTEAPAPTLAPGTKLMIASSNGSYDGIYDGVWGYRVYNWGSTLYADVVGAATVSSDDKSAAFTLNPSKSGLSTLTEATAPAGVTPIEASRYRLIPLLTNGNNSVAGLYAHTFMEKIPDFGAEDQYLSVDMLKAPGYPNVKDHVDKYKIGLAFIDYEKGGVIAGGSVKVFPTDIAWYDITDEVLALNYRDVSKTWDAQKKTISVKISDILESPDHQYVHGNPGDITADNANAVVFGFEIADKTWFYGNGNKTLAYDDLRIDAIPAPAASFSFTGSIAEGVKLTADNPGGKDIVPVIVAAYYKGSQLVDVKIDRSFTASAGGSSEKICTIESEADYDSVSVMALETLDNIKPLCASFHEAKK